MRQNTFNTEQIVDFEQVKDKIFPKLINADMNKDLLADRPHTMFHNLAVIYSIEFVFNRKDARVDVNNFLFEKYSITTEELHNLAVSNQERMKRPVIQNLYDVLSKMVEMTDDELAPDIGLSQYVLTNEKSYYGASLILHDDILQKASAKLNGDFFIIPSSVHEVILFPEEGVVPEKLNQMIQEINGNSNVISKTDVLSNNAYHYNHREHSLEIVENSLLQFKKKEKIKRNKEEAKTVRKYGMER